MFYLKFSYLLILLIGAIASSNPVIAEDADYNEEEDQAEVELFNDLDADKDGVITKEEFRAFMETEDPDGVSDDEFEDTWKHEDVDGDGTISLEEFLGPHDPDEF